MDHTAALIEAPRLGTAIRKPGFAERRVLQALRRMANGCLRVELPDGSQETIGTAGGEITANLRIRRDSFFQKVMLFGDVGFGEAYVDGDWDTDSIERVIAWAILNIENSPSMTGSSARNLFLNLLRLYNRAFHRLRPNTLRIARRNVAEHYDLGNEFYQLWLDPTMTYSSGLFATAGATLEDSQHAKYQALCHRLDLQPSDHVLEIGGGWGGFASHAVRHFGCRVTTVTLSRRQFDYANARFAREGVADRIDLRLQDYRHITGKFDKIASIEMMEALGDEYLDIFCGKLHQLLKPHGLVGLQFITVPDSRHAGLKSGVDWIQKHIFPGTLLLSINRVGRALEQSGDFFLHRLDDLGLDYARTLRAWFDGFNARLSEVRALNFDHRFIRQWNYYLQYCEAAFAMRNISVVMAVYTRPNNASLRRRS